MLKTRNLIAFSFPVASVDRAALQAAFAEHCLTEPGPLELERIGFVPPISGCKDIFVRAVGDYSAFSVGVKKKMLPSSVVNERLAAKVEAVREETGTAPKGRARKALREEIFTQMLRDAFVKSTRWNAWMDHKNGLLFVDVSSHNNAELVATTIRRALGSFQAVPVTQGDAVSIPTMFYQWLRAEEAPKPLTLGSECVIKLGDGSSSWAGRNVDLCGAELREHLDAGGMPASLGLQFMDRLSFTLDGQMIVRKFKLNDVVLEGLGDPAADALGEFDAVFMLIASEVNNLFQTLGGVFETEQMEAA